MTIPTPALLPPWAAILAVLGALGLAMAVLRTLQARRGLSPELARKGVHLTMSGVTVALPWLFDGPGPVVLLAVLALGAMLAIRYLRPVRAAVGGVIHSVGRTSVGDLCFPVAVLVLYVLAAETPVLYVIPLLLLGLADTAAALVGASHGQAAYATVEGSKSHEGSVAFASVAFLCVHVPLLLFSPVGRAESLWIAAIVALLATLVEAISWRGLDNLFVPIGAYAVLIRLLDFSASLLAGHLVVLLVLTGLAALLRRRTTIGGAGVFGAALIAYLVWALGGTLWLLPPALVYVLYARIWPAGREADGRRHDPARRPHTAHNVLSVASVGMVWLVAARVLDLDLLLPFTMAWACSLAILGVDRMQRLVRRWRHAGVAWAAAWRATLVVLVPLLAASALAPALAGFAGPPSTVEAGAAVGLCLLATGLASGLISAYKQVIDVESTDFEGRVYRAAIVGSLSALGLLIPLVP
jgi:phytol kinase